MPTTGHARGSAAPSGRRALAALAAGAVLAATACTSAAPSASVRTTGAAPSASRPGAVRIGEPGGPTATCVAPPPLPSAVPSFSAAPDPSLAQASGWVAVLHTTCGDITLALDGRSAPRTVASFVSLARGGYWRDSDCNRLTTKQAATGVLQCGDPTGRGLGDPGYALPLENVPRDGHYARTEVGMARVDAGIRSTSGEFFIVHRAFTLPPPDGPGGVPYLGAAAYTRFGRVVSGMEVVDAVAAEGGEDGRPDGPPFASISVLTVDVHRG